MKRVFILLIMSIIVFTGCTYQNDEVPNTGDTADFICETNGGNWNEVAGDCEGLSQEVCEDLNGVYNSCESPCRGTNADVCAEVCVETCEFY